MTNPNYIKFIEIMGEEVKVGEELRHYTSFKIGGKADLFYSAKDEICLQKIVKTVRDLGIPMVLIGAGNNIFFSDAGYRGLVVKNECKGEIKILENNKIFVPAGIELCDVLRFAAEHSLSGLEFASGIPGSIGGAVYMNAGAYGSSIGELVISGSIIDREGGAFKLDKMDFHFGYRSSRLQKSGEILVSIILALEDGKKEEIFRKINEIIEIRKSKHPAKDIPCAGSYFKNIIRNDTGSKRESSGYYLEKAGAKKYKVGDAEVSGKHANFIINTGSAKSSDVLKLADMMKQSVKEKFGIHLEEEVIYFGEK